MSPTTAVVTVPCFSGAPWELDQLTPLAHRPLRTMRLPEGLDTVDAHADHLAEQVRGLDDYVLVGDSFGAVIALGLAVRRPPGLRGLVLSGGFADEPLTTPVAKLRGAAARAMPAAVYRSVTLRVHAAALASAFDAEGQVPWDRAASRRLFLDNTPHASYAARLEAVRTVDYRDRLGEVEVPTLVLTPGHDVLVGPGAARTLVDGIPGATETVLPRTGHMFRFSHPVTYAGAVERFLATRVDRSPALGER